METRSNMSKLATHLANPKDPEFNLCGERSYPATTVDSVKDSICYYCGIIWENKAYQKFLAANPSWDHLWY